MGHAAQVTALMCCEWLWSSHRCTCLLLSLERNMTEADCTVLLWSEQASCTMDEMCYVTMKCTFT